MGYFLVKSEPSVFSIDDLQAKDVEPWDGVRNYQARNIMRDDMKVGDRVLFYHSNAKPPGVAGSCVVASSPYADATQFDINSNYYDPKSSLENPRWILVDMKFEQKFSRLVSLQEMKKDSFLTQMRLLQKGNRLSVMPVQKEEFMHILTLGYQ